MLVLSLISISRSLDFELLKANERVGVPPAVPSQCLENAGENSLRKVISQLSGRFSTNLNCDYTSPTDFSFFIIVQTKITVLKRQIAQRKPYQEVVLSDRNQFLKVRWVQNHCSKNVPKMADGRTYMSHYSDRNSTTPDFTDGRKLK